MELYGCMDCSAPLGMESGFIKDFQITASSQNDANHAAIQGRLNFKAGGGKRGGWSTFWNNANQWIQVALGSYTKLTSIATQGRNGHSQWVTKYKLQYSDDGVNFHYYKEPGQSSPKVFDGNKDRDSIVYHKLNPPIQAHYIRLRPTAWYGHISLRMELYGCLVQCPVLALHSLVKTSPSGCLTSQMKFNTTCSFSCPQGYQLQGPSYKHCRINGQWTDSAKSVSCNDADECSVSNGGCSHKCVNTAGGYKCKCPDPELSLALDNMTCHAPGVDVQCNRDSLTIIIPKSLLRGIDREHLRLLDTTCKAKETNADFSLTTPLTGCNTTRRQTPTAIVYSNTVLEIPVAAEDVITRVREIEIQFSCFYSKYGVVSSVGWKPSNRKLVFNDEGKGNFTLSLKMFPDKRFVSPYTKDDFPVAVVLRKLLFFEVSVTSGDKQLSIMADRCYATPTLDQQNSLKYEFITKGCPIDNTVKYHAAPLVSAQRFSLEAFNFIADHPFVFVHCHVIVCDGTDPGSKCSKKCLSSGRGRREVSDHMFGVYALSQGPLHLARQRREKKSANGLNKSGSSPIFLMALLVMCVACLVGTVVLIYKKSRDKPAGYSMLVSGEKE